QATPRRSCLGRSRRYCFERRIRLGEVQERGSIRKNWPTPTSPLSLFLAPCASPVLVSRFRRVTTQPGSVDQRYLIMPNHSKSRIGWGLLLSLTSHTTGPAGRRRGSIEVRSGQGLGARQIVSERNAAAGAWKRMFSLRSLRTAAFGLPLGPL